MLGAAPLARADLAIYGDALAAGWENWSWTSSVDFNNANPVHGGNRSIAVTVTGAWGALYLHHAAFNPSPNTAVTFWIHGGSSGGQRLQLQAQLGGAGQTPVPIPAPPANAWLQVTVSLAQLGAAGSANLDGFWFMDTSGAAQATFYVDDFSLVALPSVTLTSPAPGATFAAPATINLAASVTANGHTIDKVQFYHGSSLLGEDTSAPYGWAWAGVGVGTYSLSCRAVYGGTNQVVSGAINILVASNSPVALRVDALANRRPISPLIYGVAFASSNDVAELNAPLNRSGGNSATRYNWQLNARNTANDWYFESLPEPGSAAGAAADSHVAGSKNGGAEPLLTIPMIGWMPKLGAGRTRLASFSVAKYGEQTATDIWFSDAGNGVLTSGSYVVNDPNDASFLTNSTFQRGWVRHLVARWGASTNGGVRYYCMDNEHTIWHSTHRDVHPTGATMREIRDKFFDYAGMVKSEDPSAEVLAPEEWGWSGYLYSGYDQQWSGAHSDWNPAHFPDRGTNGGWDYIPWLLDQFRQRATNTNQRLLDYLTLHIYPQNGEYQDDVSQAMQLTRNRSTRSLWDPNYLEPNWINDYIRLIPRMRNWVSTYYPGTRIGITEYNWGAEGHINGATAQADVLGIFGREGLDLATRWTTPEAGTPTYLAMKMYRNYDGNHSGFGDTSVSATTPNPDNVSVFAAVRAADGALTVMAINKQLSAAADATISVTNQLLRGTGQVWQLTAANAINRLGDISFANNTIIQSLPPQSITLFVLPAGLPPAPRLAAGAISGTNTFDFWLNGTAGQRYVLLSSTNLTEWAPVLTNTPASNSWHIVLPVAGSAAFYRGQWAP